MADFSPAPNSGLTSSSQPDPDNRILIALDIGAVLLAAGLLIFGSSTLASHGAMAKPQRSSNRIAEKS
jgi:hypothetical protein